MAKFITFIALLLFSNVLTAQTCVLAIKTKDEIVLGADSKAGVFNGKPILICKIKHTKNIVFSLSGYIFKGMPDTIIRILNNSLEPLNNKVDNLLKTLRPIITNTCENMRNNDRKNYDMIFKDSLVCKIILCTFENNLPIMEVLIFQILNPTTQPVFITPFLNENFVLTSERPYDYRIIGDADCLNELGQDSAEKVLQHKDKFNTILHFITRQGEITPNHVSAPINIIRIKPDNTIEWICRDPTCNQ